MTGNEFAAIAAVIAIATTSRSETAARVSHPLNRRQCPAGYDSRMPGETDFAHDLLFYDGHCALCHRWVTRVLEHDAEGRFRFSPLQGQTLEQRLGEEERNALPDSIVVATADGRWLTRSAAVMHLVDRLGRPAKLFWLTLPMRLPRPVADLLYRLVARVRRPVFGRTNDACPVLPPELRERFLP